MSIMEGLLEPTPGQMMLAVAVIGAAIVLVFLIGHYHGMKKAVSYGPVASPQPKKQPKGAMTSRMVDSDNHREWSGRNSEEQSEEPDGNDESAVREDDTYEGPRKRNKDANEDTRQEHWRSGEQWNRSTEGDKDELRVTTKRTSQLQESNTGNSIPTWRRSPKKSEANASQDNESETWETGIVRFANDSFGFILRNKEELPPKYSDKVRRRDGALFFLSNDVKYNLSLQRGDRVHYRVQPGNPRATGNKAKPKAADISLISRNGVRFDAKDKLQRMKWNRPQADPYRRNSLPNTAMKSETREPDDMEAFAQQITEDDYDEDKVNLQTPVDLSRVTVSSPRRGSLQDENISAFQSPTPEAWGETRETGFGYKFSGREERNGMENPYQSQINYLRSRVMTEDILRKRA
eukprot:gb/GECG01012281.1/.p1 GENE.gb/GECG01012281.1/~~gb/GECG01012281.1/.p1  ORF type:complete len:406 (+),score=71.25 gb/GECG01012281.1/:1-1218(+)